MKIRTPDRKAKSEVVKTPAMTIEPKINGETILPQAMAETIVDMTLRSWQHHQSPPSESWTKPTGTT